MVFYVYRKFVDKMMKTTAVIKSTLLSRRAQILLPAVMLAPIFMLLIYLLFETSKISMSKVREQFALDNAAYSQMSSASVYLNAVAQINGALPYRVMKTMSTVLPAKQTAVNPDEQITVFDMFYKSGAFASIGPSYDIGLNGAVRNGVPSAEATSWGLQYYAGKRKEWNKEDPQQAPDEEERYVLTDKDLADNYFFGASTIGLSAIKEYATIFIRTGSIYASQKYVYEDVIDNGRMFRQSYYLNTQNCRKSECAKQAASTLERFELETKPFEIDKTRFYVTADYQGSTMHSGAYAIDLDMAKVMGVPLFQFAYLTSQSRSKLKQLARGVVLKQKYTLPDNRFNINLVQRYQPYVRNTISLTCPRSSNNCVWPDPIPKYSVKVGP